MVTYLSHFTDTLTWIALLPSATGKVRVKLDVSGRVSLTLTALKPSLRDQSCPLVTKEIESGMMQNGMIN